MREIVFKLVVDTDSTHGKLQRVEESLDELKAKGEKGSYYTFTTDANGKLRAVMHDLDEVQKEVEAPKEMKVSADQALATIRDVKIAVDGVLQVVGGLVRSMNDLLDASLGQRQAMTLASVAFGEAAGEMGNFASSMQQVTNFEDDKMLSLMAKLSQTFKLNKDEIQQLVPVLLDFTEANKATGMSVESAFDLMGRALNGHTEMLGRYGIELDDTRLKTEGVSYLVEKLGEDYGGTATALADLRLQNANAWGDIQETVGDMLTTLINPLLKGLKLLMDAYNSLSPVMKGFVAGIVIAIPIIGTVTTAVTALTAAYHALQIAMNPVAGIIGLAVGALSALGLGLAAASIKTDVMVESQKSMTDEIKECNRQVSIEAERFNFLATRLLELRSATNLATSDKTEMKNIIQTMNEQYGEYIGNIDLATASYNDLASALRSASEALIQKQIAEVYGERYQAQLRRVAELQVQYNDLMKTARENQSQFIQDREMLQGGPGDYWKLSPEGILNEQITQVRDNLNQAKGDLNDFAAAYRQALMELPDMSLGSAGNNGASSGNAEEERRLEQLCQLQQKYDVLAIDDAILRKQKEIEVQRDAELVKAQSLGASEELLQSIRDHYADESVRVETEAAEARTRQIEAETEERRKALEEERRQRQELSDMRFNFEQRSLDLAGQTWDAQLRAIDEYYARRREKLLKAGLTEEQITAQSEQAKAQIRKNAMQKRLAEEQQLANGVSGIYGNLSKAITGESKKSFETRKALAIVQGMIDTYSAALAAYASMAKFGPVLAAVAAAAAVAAGLANVDNIRKQEYEPPKAETGGLLVGKSHNEGGILIEAEGDEYITAKDRVRALGRNLFDFLNFAPIEKVKLAFAGLPIPSVPIPQSIGSYYAAGGSISSGGTMNTLLEIMASMRDEIVSLKQTVMDSKSVIDIHVDPLSSDPVKVSEIADTGKMIRSEV